MKLKCDLHAVHSDQKKIEEKLHRTLKEAVRKKIKTVEIIPGKGKGQLKKFVLRFQIGRAHV